MATVERHEPLSPADKKWGYSFGVDGLMSREQVAELLGVGVDTVDRYAAKGEYRKGKHPVGRRSVFCRRSVKQYLARLEI